MLSRFHALFAPGLRSAFNADGWTLVAPFGSYPFTSGGETFVQVFNEENAAEMVTSFNSLWSKLSRVIGPLFGGHACPLWKGHPDFAPEIWKSREQLGTVEGLRVSERGLEARLALNAQGEAVRDAGVHVFPSVAVECEPQPGTNRIHPKLLWSIGLWQKPNIPAVDSIATINAVEDEVESDAGTLARKDSETDPPKTGTQTKPQNNPTPPMKEKLIKLLAALGFLKMEGESEPADDQMEAALGELETSYNGMKATLAETEAAKLKAEEEKATAEDSVTATNAASEAAITALNAALVNLRTSRAEFAVQALLASGHITESERAATLTALNAEGFDVEHEKILQRGPVVKVGRLQLGGAKIGIADTANARTAVNAFTAEQQAKGKTYDEAFAASREACKEAWAILDKADAAKKPAA